MQWALKSAGVILKMQLAAGVTGQYMSSNCIARASLTHSNKACTACVKQQEEGSISVLGVKFVGEHVAAVGNYYPGVKLVHSSVLLQLLNETFGVFKGISFVLTGP